MAVIQKKTNELESMMASFAVIPDFEKAGTDPKKDKRDVYKRQVLKQPCR